MAVTQECKKKNDKDRDCPKRKYIGKKVVHVPEGVCIITEICRIKNDSCEEREFYKLSSVKNQMVVYVPVDSAEKHMRKLRSREEILDILQNCNTTKTMWDSNEQKRIAKRRKAMQEDDGRALAKLIKSYYRRKAKTNISVADRNWLKKAEQFLCSEIEEVLHIDYEKALSEVTG